MTTPLRHALSCGESARRVPGFVCAVFVAAACGPAAQPGTPDAGTDLPAPETAPACSPIRQRPNGTCCPEGFHFDATARDCLAAGPAACPDAIDAPHGCWPSVCAAGLPCSATDAAAGCPAGTFADVASSGVCVPAGAWMPGTPTPTLGAVPPDALPVPITAQGVPPGADLPDLDHVSFCATADGPALCEASASTCAPGSVPAPAPGGGCVTVGVPWSCPAGFVVGPAAPGATAVVPPCVPDPTDCGSDAFGGIANGPGRVFALAGATPPFQGTRSQPFATLAAALNATPTGGTLVIGAGKYASALGIDRDMTLHGRCAAQVELTYFTVGGIGVKPGKTATQVVVRGLTLRGQTFAAGVTGKASLRLERVWVDGTVAYGAIALQGGHLELVESVVARVRRQGLANAIGIGVDGATLAELTDVRVTDCDGVGVHATDGAHVRLQRSLVDHVVADGASDGYVGGVNAEGGARIELESVRVVDIAGYAVRALDPGSRVVGHGVRIDRARRWQAVGSGNCVVASQGGHADLAAVVVSRCDNCGVAVLGGGARIRGLIASEGGTTPDPEAARGALVVTGEAFVDARSLWLRGFGLTGLGLAGGATVVAADVRIDAPAAPSTAQGFGVFAWKNTTLHLDRALVRGASVAGIAVLDRSRFTGSWLSLEGTRAGPTSKGLGFGWVVDGSSHASGTGVSVRGCQGACVVVTGGSSLAAHGLAVAGVEPVGAGAASTQVALAVTGAAHATLQGVRVVSAPLGATGPSARLDVTGAWLDGTAQGALPRRYGGYVMDGAMLALTASRVTRHGGVGLIVHRGHLTVRDSVLLDAMLTAVPHPSSAEPVHAGDGLVAFEPVGLDVARCAFAGHGRVGVLVDGAGPALVASSVVTGCPVGVATQGGALLTTPACAVYGNPTANRVSDQGLALPPPPTLVDPGGVPGK